MKGRLIARICLSKWCRCHSTFQEWPLRAFLTQTSAAHWNRRRQIGYRATSFRTMALFRSKAVSTTLLNNRSLKRLIILFHRRSGLAAMNTAWLRWIGEIVASTRWTRLAFPAKGIASLSPWSLEELRLTGGAIIAEWVARGRDLPAPAPPWSTSSREGASLHWRMVHTCRPWPHVRRVASEAYWTAVWHLSTIIHLHPRSATAWTAWAGSISGRPAFQRATGPRTWPSTTVRARR